jgi:hypothetical protein
MIPVFTRIIAVSIVCMATLSCLAMPLSARSGPATVLVFAFENQTDDRNIDWIGTGLSDLVVERLTADGAIRLVVCAGEADRDRVSSRPRGHVHADQSLARCAQVRAVGRVGSLPAAQVVLRQKLDVPEVLQTLHGSVEARGVERRMFAQVVQLTP